jgi:hypothetical protein
MLNSLNDSDDFESADRNKADHVETAKSFVGSFQFNMTLNHSEKIFTIHSDKGSFFTLLEYYIINIIYLFSQSSSSHANGYLWQYC